MENKSSKVIIIILVLMVLGLSGYIVYDKFFAESLEKEVGNPEQEINNSEQAEYKELDLESDFVKTLLDKIGNVNMRDNDSEPSNYLYVAPMVYENLSNDKKLGVVLDRLYFTELNDLDAYIHIDENFFALYKSLFGNDTEIEYQDARGHFYRYDYDEDNNRFVIPMYGIGGGQTLYDPRSIIHTLSVREYADRIELDQKVGLFTFDGSDFYEDYVEKSVGNLGIYLFDLQDRIEGKYLKTVVNYNGNGTYSTVDQEKGLVSKVINIEYEEVQYGYNDTIQNEITEIFNQNIDLLGTYTFVFKKDSVDNYYLYEVKYNK